jgi:hypothetical protein
VTPAAAEVAERAASEALSVVLFTMSVALVATDWATSVAPSATDFVTSTTSFTAFLVVSVAVMFSSFQVTVVSI